MTPEIVVYLTLAVLIVAFLYSCVGHAGASGYIAVMALFSVAPAEIKPAALVLNVLVASIASYQFWRAGHFSWSLFWPFALLAMPMAFVGGYMNLPAQHFKFLIGVILLLSAVRFLIKPADDSVKEKPGTPAALGIGAGLGLLSGLTGTGGGIFLTPLLLMKRWATAKNAAAVSALFILLNSASGLIGTLLKTPHIPSFTFNLAIAAIIGGTIGSRCGSRRFDHTLIKRILAVVLFIAGSKWVFGG